VSDSPNRPVLRQCGECNLCCKLLPTYDNEPWRDGDPINKPAGVRCPHQRHRKGCAIYANRPFCCQVWNCRWLVNDDTADLPRPDRARYVIDLSPDYVTVRNNETGADDHIPVVQIWIDPKHPNAHRDASLRRYLERRADEGIAALVRFNEDRSIVILAPALSQDAQWHEVGDAVTEHQHSFEDMQRLLGPVTVMVSES
jgi:hypothetical protein